MLALSLMLASGQAAFAVTDAPQPSGEQFCGVSVTARAFADRADKLAFELWAPGTSGGTLSGTLVVYADNRRYDIPFAHAEVASATASHEPKPVVVQFPDAVSFESAYIGSLPEQNLPQCSIFSPVIGPGAGGHKLRVVPDTIAGVDPIKAPLPIPALPVSCKVAYRDPYVGYTAQADGPLVMLVNARVTVTALLKADGKVLGFTVAGSDDPSLRNRAINATNHSVFYPEIYRCSPVAGQYAFQVNFQPNETRLTAAIGSVHDVTYGVQPEDVQHSRLDVHSREVDRLNAGGSSCVQKNDSDHCDSPVTASSPSH